MGILSPKRVIIKRTDLVVDENHPHGTYQQIDMEVQNPNAGDGALSPLQLEPHELTKYMRMRQERREERRMNHNQVLLGRFSAANENKPIPAATRCKDMLMQQQGKIDTLA